MTAHQLNLILKKIRENIKNTDFETSYGTNYIRKAISHFKNGDISVTCESTKFIVRICPANQIKAIESDFKFPLKIKFLSLHWWKWRSLCSELEKEFKRQEKVDLENEARWTIECIDRAIIETFPDIIENELLREDYED
jgi:hypothetical protein